MNRHAISLFVASGALASVTTGQVVVTGAGATLQEEYFDDAATTNDFIDVDQDGFSGIDDTPFVDQLASGNPTGPNDFFFFHYQVVGSGSGIRTLDLYANIFDNNPAGTLNAPGSASVFLLNGVPVTDAEDVPGNTEFTDRQVVNGTSFSLNGGNLASNANAASRANLPLHPNPANGYQGVVPGTGTSGFTVDFAAADVPLLWFQQDTTAPADPLRAPGSAGYGRNQRVAVSKTTGLAVNQANDLIELQNVNTDTDNPDANTVYEFALANVAVAGPVNYGVGRTEFFLSELRHLAATGRLLSGENLQQVSRDRSSGTHNTWMNGVGLDPSFGVGENVEDRSTAEFNDRVGPLWQPSNKGGSSRNEDTVENTRLGLGHSGASRQGDELRGNRYEIVGISNDLKGGSLNVFGRPNTENSLGVDAIGNPLANPADAYSIIGPAAVSVLGDPRNAAPDLGGWGWRGEDRNQNGVLDAGEDINNNGQLDPNETGSTPFVDANMNPNPAPANPGVSAFLNNIFRGLPFFESFPSSATDFSPAENLAFNFILPDASVAIPETVPSSDTQPIPFIPNPTLNPALTAARFADLADLQTGSEFDAANLVGGGETPARNNTADLDEADDGLINGSAAAPVYSDSALVTDAYITQGGSIRSYSQSPAGNPANGALLRNRVAFDFNGDGVRGELDAQPALEAIRQREGGAAFVPAAGTGSIAGAPGNDLSIEIIGDITGDGNYNRDDVRYWADGLCLSTDAGLDVIPILGADTNNDGAIDDFTQGDNVVDATLDRTGGFTAVDDASLIVFGTNNFFGTTLATGTYEAGDSRGDIAGGTNLPTPNFNPNGHDGMVDAEDIDYVRANTGTWFDLSSAVQVDAGTSISTVIDLSCDMNGDLVINEDDVTEIIEDILDTEIGDVDLDGDVDQDDLDIVTGNDGLSPAGYADGDVDGDGDVDSDDADLIDIGSGGCNAADIAEPFGQLDLSDVQTFLIGFGGMDPVADIAGGTPDGPDGMFDLQDVQTFLIEFGAGCP